jgi:hypothetical protein
VKIILDDFTGDEAYALAQMCKRLMWNDFDRLSAAGRNATPWTARRSSSAASLRRPGLIRDGRASTDDDETVKNRSDREVRTGIGPFTWSTIASARLKSGSASPEHLQISREKVRLAVQPQGSCLTGASAGSLSEGAHVKDR